MASWGVIEFRALVFFLGESLLIVWYDEAIYEAAVLRRVMAGLR